MWTLIREVSGSLKYYGHVFGEREITIVSTLEQGECTQVRLASWKSANRFDLHSFEMTVDWAALVRNSDFLENAKSFHEHSSYDSKFLYHSDIYKRIDRLVRATTFIPLFSLAWRQFQCHPTRRDATRRDTTYQLHSEIANEIVRISSNLLYLLYL